MTDERQIKSHMEAALAAIEAGSPGAVRSELQASFRKNTQASLLYLRQKELLFRPKSAQRRRQFREAILEQIVEHDPGGHQTRLTLPYLYYCDIAADLRDEISLRANNDAQVLAALPRETYTELATMAVASLVRQYVDRAKIENNTSGPSEADDDGPQVPSRLIGAINEISGTYDLLPSMLLEISSAVRNEQHRKPTSLLDALRAAQRLCRSAEDWQLLTHSRQRVGWGRDNVSRVEPGYTVYLDSAEPVTECQRLAARRRKTLVRSGFQRQPTAPFQSILMPFIDPLILDVRRFLPDSLTPDELATEVLFDLASATLPSDTVLFEIFVQDHETAHAARSLFSAYLLRMIYSYTNRRLCRGSATYLPRWRNEELWSLVASSAHVKAADVSQAMKLVTWNPATEPARRCLDLSTVPYVDLDDARTGMLLLPGVRVSPFDETRRVLASMNRLSAKVGASYETYVQSIVERAGFQTKHGIKLRDERRTLTDVDVLGYKEGMLLIIQAKHIVEPDSFHATWKAQQELAYGVRQCIVARRWFTQNPERIFSIFPDSRVHVPIDLMCLVVTSAMEFCGDLHWPVPVVDDAYLQHVVDIGETKIVKNDTGETVQSMPMYDGLVPSAHEFRRLMMFPEYLHHYRGSAFSLRTAIHNVLHVRFSRMEAHDGIS